MTLDNLPFHNTNPDNPKEGDICMNDDTNMLMMYMGGEWVTPGFEAPELHINENLDERIRKHSDYIKKQHRVIKALIDQMTELQLKVKTLEQIVGTENRFKNTIREIQSDQED